MRPFSLLIKPTGPDCNIACQYCFYACKTSIFGTASHRMTDQILETLVRDFLKLNLSVSGFAFQGGEPTLMGLDFYKKVVELQKTYGRPGQVISNSLQTNAIALDEQWCRFLYEFNWLVGISLDGPKHIHDYYRRDKGQNPTFDRVMAALQKCREYNVQFNILVLLNDKNVSCPDELFDFFTNMKITFLQFVPCAERDQKTGNIADFSITAKQYGDFLCRIFDRWLDYGPRKLSIRLFDSVINYLLQGQHTNCSFGRKCSDYIVIEHNGDAFCCDFFVEQQYRLGNICETPIEQLANNRIKRSFSSQKARLNNKCLICRHLNICRGGCPKDRLIVNGGVTDLNYYCEAYKRFFDYSLGKLAELAADAVGNQPKT